MGNQVFASAAIALLAMSVAVPIPAEAQVPALSLPGVVLQSLGVYRFNVGKVGVISLSDGTVPQDLHKLLIGTTTAKTNSLLPRGYLANLVEASINVCLLALSNRLALIDTGSGDMFGRGLGGTLRESLAAAGIQPDRVTDILITHVHTDHTGGLVQAGRRAFPNATVHVGEPDMDFFMDRANAAKFGYDVKYYDEAITTLQPYADADRIKTFDRKTKILPGLTASLHPWHVPGSAFDTLESSGRWIIFVGDIIHVSSVQFFEPGIAITYDVDPVHAAAVRTEQFPVFVRDRSLVAAPHMPFPGVEHVRVARARNLARPHAVAFERRSPAQTQQDKTDRCPPTFSTTTR